MGEQMRRLTAQKRLLEASAVCEIDLAECPFTLSEADRAQLETAGIPAVLAIARLVVFQAVQAAYPQGMDRRDGQLYAGWQEQLNGDRTITDKATALATAIEVAVGARPSVLRVLTVTQGQIDWLLNILSKDDLKLPAGMAQWREALIEYLAEVRYNRDDDWPAPADTAAN